MTEIELIIKEAIDEASTIRHDNDGSLADQQKELGKMLKSLPGRLKAEDIATVDGCNAGAMVASLVSTCQEHQHLEMATVMIIWRTRAWTSRGKVVRAAAGATSTAYREEWPGEDTAPWWRLDINLPAWLLHSEEENMRLLHHELGHCGIKYNEVDVGDGQVIESPVKPMTVDHDVEEFVATVARYGAYDPVQAALAACAASKDDFEKMVQAWVEDNNGQGRLLLECK